MKRTALVLACFLSVSAAQAETGEAAWLRYAPVNAPYPLPAVITTLESSAVSLAAQSELIRAVQSMFGRTPRSAKQIPPEACVLLGTLDSIRATAPGLALLPQLPENAYLLRIVSFRGHSMLVVTADNERGVLYGVFALIRKLALQEPFEHLNELSAPYAPIRWTNEWDNLNGAIERGYGGRSLFFENGSVVPDLTRAGDYARLLASVGINGCTVNNVNSDLRILAPDFLPQLARVAEAFRPWGVRLSIAVDFSSPKMLGGLNTFDPLDPEVAAWWKGKVDQIYRAIPDLGGILIKADSEGRVGPSAYGRTHADAANVIARALKPHGGVLVYRGFVYNHNMDWRDPKNDRARAAYDNFKPLDGKFDDNVLIQIKHGPIDFQVREPVSPLFGALAHTNETIEFQVTQEYTGQQRQLCFLLPMWKQVLAFDMHVGGGKTAVEDIVAGKAFHRPLGGFVGVTNVGRDPNWLGFDLAMANLYAFGRIAWNPHLDSGRVIDEWTRQTFGAEPQVVQAINSLELGSWRTYENYTGPLGAGGLTDIIRGPNGAVGNHYGPGIESSERNGWGQWHRADANGVGMDRSVGTGTGYTAQYPPEVAALYESLTKCPDNLLLFMHHVPYTFTLHSGKTVIQHIYDSHYEGAAEAQTYPERWRKLRGLIDDGRFHSVLKKLEYQAGYSVVWRDAVCDWFFKTSGIPDAQGRVGHHPGRVEAESMTLDEYQAEPVVPWEGASGGRAIICPVARCTATSEYKGAPGWYDLGVEYFDQNNGASRFVVAVNGQTLDDWTADDNPPTPKPDAHSSTRHTIRGVALRPGDRIRVTGTPDQGERAALDYVEIEPARN